MDREPWRRSGAGVEEESAGTMRGRGDAGTRRRGDAEMRRRGRWIARLELSFGGEMRCNINDGMSSGNMRKRRRLILSILRMLPRLPQDFVVIWRFWGGKADLGRLCRLSSVLEKQGC